MGQFVQLKVGSNIDTNSASCQIRQIHGGFWIISGEIEREIGVISGEVRERAWFWKPQVNKAGFFLFLVCP